MCSSDLVATQQIRRGIDVTATSIGAEGLRREGDPDATEQQGNEDAWIGFHGSESFGLRRHI